MAELDLTNAFNDCVDRLAEGQSLDDCLRRYPQFASTLRPMLETGLLVQRIRIQPNDIQAAQTRVRRRFEDALRAPPPKRTSPARRFVYALAAILIIGFISVFSLSSISDGSLPGDPLYGVKIFSEGLQQTLLNNDTLEASFNQRRIQEIQQLLALGRSEQVTFNGVITSQNETNWIIASLPITVQPDIPNATIARVGDEVNVTARTSELKTLTALSIQIVEANESPLPTPTINTVVPTVTIPGQTPTPTSTATPSLTPTLMQTNTLQPSATKIVPTIVISTATSAAPIPTECAAVRPNGWVSYQIQSGDTLSALASSTSITLAELMTVNCITDARRIIVGETIYLPKSPTVAPTLPANTNNTPDSGGSNSASNNSGSSDDSGSSSPTDDHGSGSNSGSGGGGNSGSGGSGGGGSDDGSGHT